MESSHSEQRKIVRFVFLILALSAIGTQMVPMNVAYVPGWRPVARCVPARILWYSHTDSQIDELKSSGRPLLINFRANWDLLTVMHEGAALDKPEVRSLLRLKNVVPIRVECSTISSEEIDNAQTKFGAGYIPFVVIHPNTEGSEPTVLQWPFQESDVISALKSL